MVSLQRNNFCLRSNALCYFQAVINRTNLERNIIHNFSNCRDCRRMAALPQGAFVACKLREQVREKDLIVSRLKTGGEKNEPKDYIGNKRLMEYSPLKYNEKLMNSIWGFYNRYSPHNIKSNEIVSCDFFNSQQQW